MVMSMCMCKRMVPASSAHIQVDRKIVTAKERYVSDLVFFFGAGTLEEKIFQRQLSKEGLSNVVNQSGKSSASLLSSEDLADLFTPEFDSLSSTYEGMVEADLNKGASGRWVEMTQEQKAASVLREQVRCAAL